MSKRTTTGSRVENPRHYWPTPSAAVEPLLPYLKPGTFFAEPCAGDGRLVRHLEAAGHRCVAAFDVEPRGPGIRQLDARDLKVRHLRGAEVIATNPPWSRDLVVPMLDRWLALGADVWLLCPWDWAANVWWSDYAPVTVEAVPVGRVKWVEGSKFSGKENVGWLRLDPANRPGFLRPRLTKSGMAQTRAAIGPKPEPVGSTTYAQSAADSTSAA